MITVRLNKLKSENSEPVKYRMVDDKTNIDINSLINNNLSLRFSGKITCEYCGNLTKKSFGQGYCYNCFVTCPETEPCILNPEKCKIQWGNARDVDWAKEHHLQAHAVYLSYTSGVKVGVTRLTQIPTRWIDQGAIAAVPLLKVPNRYIAGVVEVYMKDHFADKTNWSSMLVQNRNEYKFEEDITRFMALLPDEFSKYKIPDAVTTNIRYPLNLNGMHKLSSVNLDKESITNVRLLGIKGQYLVFEDGKALNIRKHTGYIVEITVH